MANLPYVQTTGSLEIMLEKIKTASVPEKFSQDYVSTKLQLKGGSGRALIPFIKKMGLVASDGTPTDRYREFRNPAKSGVAIAKAMRELYETLFEMNEYVYELDNNKLKSIIIEATGAEANSTVVQKTLSTFCALKKLHHLKRTKTTVQGNQMINQQKMPCPKIPLLYPLCSRFHTNNPHQRVKELTFLTPST